MVSGPITSFQGHNSNELFIVASNPIRRTSIRTISTVALVLSFPGCARHSRSVPDFDTSRSNQFSSCIPFFLQVTPPSGCSSQTSTLDILSRREKSPHTRVWLTSHVMVPVRSAGCGDTDIQSVREIEAGVTQKRLGSKWHSHACLGTRPHRTRAVSPNSNPVLPHGGQDLAPSSPTGSRDPSGASEWGRPSGPYRWEKRLARDPCGRRQWATKTCVKKQG